MERENQIIPSQKAEKIDWLIRQYFRAIYAVGVTFCLALAVGGTAVEVKRAVEGDFGKPAVAEELSEDPRATVPYGPDVGLIAAASAGVVGLGTMKAHRRLWLGKLMKLGTEPNN